MEIEHVIVRQEKETDYRKVEVIAGAAFNYPDRIMRSKIGCPYARCTALLFSSVVR